MNTLALVLVVLGLCARDVYYFMVRPNGQAFHALMAVFWVLLLLVLWTRPA
jgi:hypothetical protein